MIKNKKYLHQVHSQILKLKKGKTKVKNKRFGNSNNYTNLKMHINKT